MAVGFVAQARATARVRLWVPHLARHFRIRARFPRWNRPQRFPHAPLKRRGRRRRWANPDGGRTLQMPRTIARTHSDCSAELAPDFRTRIFLTKRRDQARVVFSQAHGGDAAIGGGHEHAAQRAIRNRVGDIHSAASPADRWQASCPVARSIAHRAGSRSRNPLRTLPWSRQYPFLNLDFSRAARIASAYCRGVMPMALRNVRCKCAVPSPATAAKRLKPAWAFLAWPRFRCNAVGSHFALRVAGAAAGDGSAGKHGIRRAPPPRAERRETGCCGVRAPRWTRRAAINSRRAHGIDKRAVGRASREATAARYFLRTLAGKAGAALESPFTSTPCSFDLQDIGNAPGVLSESCGQTPWREIHPPGSSPATASYLCQTPQAEARATLPGGVQ